MSPIIAPIPAKMKAPVNPDDQPIEKIPESFEMSGSQWEEIDRDGEVVIYTQTLGTELCYNVMTLIVEKGRERMPRPSEWGSHAWTYDNKRGGYGAAINKFNSIKDDWNGR